MASTTIPLGPVERVKRLYSYPNDPRRDEPIEKTVEHWFGLTLKHDGLASEGATCRARSEGGSCTLTLEGPDDVEGDFEVYAERLPRFLEIGWSALEKDVAAIRGGRASKPWDPNDDGWRFFLHHGLPMSRQRTLQFFHYPPIRLLLLGDYLKDPVPWRVEELLVANGVESHEEAWLYERVMDATPIGASDDEGQKGTIPIDSFYDYQVAMTRLLLNTSEVDETYTIPIVVYGQHPKRVFSKLFLPEGVKLRSDEATLVEDVVEGKKTPVMGSTHPYAFYGQAQSGRDRTGTIGSGHIRPDACRDAVERMKKDLVVARWQKTMADDPTRDPKGVLEESRAYWEHPDRAGRVCALVLHEGSLHYPNMDDPDPVKAAEFEYLVELDRAAELCRAHGDDPCASLDG